MDDTDRELLRLLALDARSSIIDLSRALGVSRATVQNRIDRLRASGTIRRFTVELGKNAEGTLVDAIVLITLATGDSRKTISDLRRLKEVESLAATNGVYDLAVEMKVASLHRLDEILAEIRRMPMIENTNSIIRLRRFK